MVLQLKKAHYGLKQSSREWRKYLDRFLIALGCERCEADQMLYIYRFDNQFVFLVVYVDDILMVADDEASFEWVLDAFRACFEIRATRVVDKFLCFTVDDKGDEFRLHNAPMINKMLEDFKMPNCKSVPTPLPSGNLSRLRVRC